jgi:hypothetical protein
VNRLKTGPAMASIRKRDDFQSVVKQLEGNNSSPR